MYLALDLNKCTEYAWHVDFSYCTVVDVTHTHTYICVCVCVCVCVCTYVCVYIYKSEIKFSRNAVQNITNTLKVIMGDRGGTVVKVLCYKLEGRWFDSRWCHWNFSLT